MLVSGPVSDIATGTLGHHPPHVPHQPHNLMLHAVYRGGMLIETTKGNNYRARRKENCNTFRKMSLIVLFVLVNQTKCEAAIHVYCLNRSIINTKNISRQSASKTRQAIVSHLKLTKNKKFSWTIIQIASLTLITVYGTVVMAQLRFLISISITTY